MWLAIMLMAFWSIYIQDGQINRDGLLYLKQAYLISEGDLKEGLAFYPWPFFSILIAAFHKLTNLHLQVVAHGVDLALFGIATLFYLKTLQLIYNKEKHIIFYGGIVLLSFIPIMDDYMGMVLRDHGLWAGCMMGTFYYFKSIKEPSWNNIIFWQAGFLFASLFRLEGLIFLFLIPIWRFIRISENKFNQLFKDYILIIILSILLIFLEFILENNLNLLNNTRLIDFLFFFESFLNKTDLPIVLSSSDPYLSNSIIKNIDLIYFSIILIPFIVSWLKAISFFHGALFIYSIVGFKKNFYQKELFLFIFLSFVIVSFIYFSFYITTTRYWIIHIYWLFIFIAPSLHYLIESRLKFISKSIVISIIGLLMLQPLFDNSNNLEKEIASYIIDNRLDGIDFNNNHRVMYYVFNDLRVLIENKSNIDKKYMLIKWEKNVVNMEVLHDSILKNFPENKPKFSLIKK